MFLILSAASSLLYKEIKMVQDIKSGRIDPAVLDIVLATSLVV